MTLARKILLKAKKPGDCPFISKDNMGKVQTIMAEKKVQRRHPHPNLNEDIIEIFPCTEDGKVTLETQLKSKARKDDFFSDFFDQYQLCTSLRESELFDTMNCSPKIGYALTEIMGKRTHIFKTGKIIMRRADNREDALDTFSKISRVLLPARICSCGNILVDCFGGCCEDCLADGCAALIDDLKDKEVDGQGKLTIMEVLKESENLIDNKLRGNFNALDDITNEIRKIVTELEKGHLVDNNGYKNRIDEAVTKINKTCSDTFLENKDITNVLTALTQYGLGRDLVRVRDGFISLDIRTKDERYEHAKELFFDAFEAFEGRDEKASKAVRERYRALTSGWNAQLQSAGIAKIATNGFYISRVLGKTVSDSELLERGKS